MENTSTVGQSPLEPITEAEKQFQQILGDGGQIRLEFAQELIRSAVREKKVADDVRLNISRGIANIAFQMGNGVSTSPVIRSVRLRRN